MLQSIEEREDCHGQRTISSRSVRAVASTEPHGEALPRLSSFLRQLNTPLPEHSIAANIGLAWDQELEHEQSLLELSEGPDVVHAAVAVPFSVKTMASPLSLIRASSWLASLFEFAKTDDGSPITIEGSRNSVGSQVSWPLGSSLETYRM